MLAQQGKLADLVQQHLVQHRKPGLAVPRVQRFVFCTAVQGLTVPETCVDINIWIFMLYQWSRNVFICWYMLKSHPRFMKMSVILLHQQEPAAI